jgi:hypothetical protein
MTFRLSLLLLVLLTAIVVLARAPSPQTPAAFNTLGTTGMVSVRSGQVTVSAHSSTGVAYFGPAFKHTPRCVESSESALNLGAGASATTTQVTITTTIPVVSDTAFTYVCVGVPD